ncbi:hypothetical protein [Herbaspirillum rubrisubalbicans]|uniref:hypothetical protein n=1 Tax=Herbaspirillum rubrisubalbicans TaxID=80842 RepID=UPI0015C526E4|nr:hypothetical protein [Herbaspirillum rubrisubalbicans]NQE47593.1 hypothetical protein [Herbaspirillum rubrisubalbicans]
MGDINWVLLLDYLRVVLSWPPMALIIALVAMFKFKSAIDDLLKRIIGGKFLGQEIQVAPPQVAPQGSVTAPDNLVPTQLADAPVSDATASGVPHLSGEEPLPPELANDPRARAAISWVRANPVQTVIEYKKVSAELSSERLFMRIFGTQISLLAFLASRNGEPVSALVLSIYHGEYQRLSGNAEYPFERYMDFLVGAGALEKIEGDIPQYRVTQFGVDFLGYIKAQYPLAWTQRAF